ncbi:hypothetical protein EfmAA96_15780 [Enterococcus faecium]|nr:hypothetical protein EfmAA96_15780 [Enterococcus faecium]
MDAKQFTMSITFSNVVEQHLNTLNNTKKISTRRNRDDDGCNFETVVTDVGIEAEVFRKEK